MAQEQAGRDQSYTTSLIGLSQGLPHVSTNVWVDETTHRMLVSGTITGGSTIPAAGASTAVSVQIVDGSGNQITSFGGGTQYLDGGTPPAHATAATLVYDNAGAWKNVDLTHGFPVNIVAGGGTGGGPADVGVTTAASESDSARQKVTAALRLLDTGQGAGSQLVGAKGDQTSGLWVNVKASAAIALTTSSAVIGHVIVDSGSTTAVTGNVASTVADGANVTLGAKADAKSTATDTTAITIMSVLKQISASVQAPPSQAITNAGTFAVQDTVLDAALIAQEATTSGVKGLTMFGAVTTAKPTYTTLKSDALSLDVNGLLRVSLADTPANGSKFLVTADAITVAASQTIAVTQATAASLNATVVGTGTFVVQATLAAETTKAIGVVRNSDGAGNLLTSNSTTPSAHFALDSNITSILGTAPTTVGKLDVKGADGDVFVRQTTAANLNATVVGTGTFAVQADTELAAALADGDGIATTTTAPVIAYPVVFNGGTTFDRLRGGQGDGASSTGLQDIVPRLYNGTTYDRLRSGVGTAATGAVRTVEANDAGKTLVSKGGSASSSGDNTIVAAGTNKLKVYAFSLSTISTAQVTCVFQSGASGTELWRVTLQAISGASTGANLVVQPPAWLFATAGATLLNLNLSSANAVHWSVSYYDEA